MLSLSVQILTIVYIFSNVVRILIETTMRNTTYVKIKCEYLAFFPYMCKVNNKNKMNNMFSEKKYLHFSLHSKQREKWFNSR